MTLPLQRPGAEQRRHRVHDAAVDHHGGDGAEHAQGGAAAAQPAPAEQHARQKADDAHGEHLERRPRALGEQHVAGQHGHGAHQKARLAAQRHAGDDGQRQHRLELGQHEERRAARHAQRAQDGHEHQLPRLGTASLEHKEEGRHTFQQHREGHEVILRVPQPPEAQIQRQPGSAAGSAAPPHAYAWTAAASASPWEAWSQAGNAAPRRRCSRTAGR